MAKPKRDSDDSGRSGPLYVGVTVRGKNDHEFKADGPIVLLEFTQCTASGETRLFAAVLPIESAGILASDIVDQINQFFAFQGN